MPTPASRSWRRPLAAVVLSASLAGSTGCARQLSNRQIAIGAAAAIGITALVVLAVHQCRKGPAYCDNER